MVSKWQSDPSRFRADAPVDFLAFDVETASTARASICAIGGAVGIDGGVHLGFSSLVNPECAFNGYNIGIHGIRPADVEDEPTLPGLWNSLVELFGGETLVAHSAGFDVGALRSSAHRYDLELPDIEVYCSVEIAKRVWPSLPSYRLAYLGQILGIEFKHHDAGDDARACAMVVLAAEQQLGVASLQELVSAIGLHPRRLGGVRHSITSPSDRAPRDLHPLLGKRVCFTGTMDSMTRPEAVASLEDVGGESKPGVSKLIDYLVIGDGPYADFLNGIMTSKPAKAIELVAEGYGVEIIPEHEFLTLLYS